MIFRLKQNKKEHKSINDKVRVRKNEKYENDAQLVVK